MPLEAGTRLGHYEILAPLGAGGMGAVYKGRDTRLDRTQALTACGTRIGTLPQASLIAAIVEHDPPPKSIFLTARLNEGGSVLSPDGSMLAFSARTEGRMQLWVRRVGSLEARALPGTEGGFYPFWSPDGATIVFTLRVNLYRKAASGAGNPERLTTSALQQFPQDWSKDGRYLLLVELGAKTGPDLMVLEVGGVGKPIPFLQTPFNEQNGRFSPGGARWIAYTSDESGTREIYVQEFRPGRGASGARWQISAAVNMFDRRRLSVTVPVSDMLSE